MPTLDRETHLGLLGLATARGHQLEIVTSDLLGRALIVPHAKARLLAASLGQYSALTVLQTLSSRHDCGQLDPAALASWVRKAEAANTARNRVMHSPWVTEDGDPGPSLVPTRGVLSEPRGEAELREDIALMAAAVEAVSALY